MDESPFDLSGKVALITGGNRGIGFGMAKALARANAHVAIWGRQSDANAKAVDELSELGYGDVGAWVVDVSDEDAVVEATAEVISEFDRIDTCIANAGVGFGAPSFAEMSTETWRSNMAINLDGAFWTMRESAKHMVERGKTGDLGGSIIVVSSMAALEGAARNQAYAATKGAVISMMKGVAVEHARYGVRANAILPGWIATDMTETAQDSDKFNSNVISRVPMRRWGAPEDFGGIVVYLSSNASAFHTGDTFVIDGGYTIF